MISKTYFIYGLIVLAGVALAEYRGMSLTPVTELKGVPKSVRDNPGSYRAVYSGYRRYTGGK